MTVATLLLAALCCCALALVRAGDTVTVEFTLIMPNASFPLLGEYWQGSLTYNATADPHSSWPGYSNGHAITGMTGTRTVWTATASSPTDYQLNSTASILGLLPAPNCYAIYNTSIVLAPGVQPISCVDFATYNNTGFLAFWGSWVVVGGYNLSDYSVLLPNGHRPFPFVNTAYDNFFYDPAVVPDAMDVWGWAVWLDRAQPGTVNASVDPRYPGYEFVVHPSSEGSPSSVNTVSDLNFDDYDAADYGYGDTGYGFKGGMTISPQSTGSSVLGDPSFVGLLGQRYQVHGVDGQVYSIIIDDLFHLNARFVFLSSGRCPPPATDGSAASACWSHPGSYLGQLGLVTAAGSRLVVDSGTASVGFARVALDDVKLSTGQTVTAAGLSVTLHDAYRLTVRVSAFELQLSNSDRFVNLQQLRVLPGSRLHSHGLLGQTWRRPRSAAQEVADVEGWIDDYAEQDNDLLGRRFLYQRIDSTD